jgi:hypothetical protein
MSSGCADASPVSNTRNNKTDANLTGLPSRSGNLIQRMSRQLVSNASRDKFVLTQNSQNVSSLVCLLL